MPEMTDFCAFRSKSVSLRQSKQSFFVKSVTKNDQISKKIRVIFLFDEQYLHTNEAIYLIKRGIHHESI